MYAAKHAGRNCFRYFTPALQIKTQQRKELIHDIRQALENHEFWLAYQPIVNLHTGQIDKAEALLRWNHPYQGLLSPAKFIPIAEDTGLIVEIGDFVFREAVKQVSIWQRALNPDFSISINESPLQFTNEQASISDWINYLKDHSISGKQITVEITEGLLLNQVPIVESKLQGLRDANIEVALDDFGTGYSSLSCLQSFHIDFIKIDRSFVRNLSFGSNELIMCEAMILMAHKLGIKVIAEGIETEIQRDLLTAAGCDYGQGYLFYKPLSAMEFEAIKFG